jgi:hypothetical protein
MIDNQIKSRKVRKPDLTPKQRKFIKGIAAGKGKAESAIAAGYPAPGAGAQASKMLRNDKITGAIQSVWDKCGLSDQYIGNKVKALTEAKRVQFFAKDGIVTDERITDDTAVQRSSIELAARLKGLLVDRSLSVNVSIDISPVDLAKYRNDDIIDV